MSCSRHLPAHRYPKKMHSHARLLQYAKRFLRNEMPGVCVSCTTNPYAMCIAPSTSSSMDAVRDMDAHRPNAALL